MNFEAVKKSVIASFMLLLLQWVIMPVTGWADVVRVAVISDLNSVYGSTDYEASVSSAIGSLVRQKPDLVLSTGDMVAGQRLHPLLTTGEIEAMWLSFHRTVTAPLTAAGIPLAVTPGNHDASAYKSFGLERGIYHDQWLDHRPAVNFIEEADYPFRYAFSAGYVLFISLDVTRVGSLGAEQKAWLDELLIEHGGKFLHRVVFAHLPIYPIAQGRETEITADHELEGLLRRHDVELFLSGHHHAFYPGFHDGVRHVAQACLGAGPRRWIGTAEQAGRAITWLEFSDDGVVISAMTGAEFDQPVDFHTLPESIKSRYGTLVRDDLR